MAFYTGYINLPTVSYSSWKNAVAGNGYDADGFYGDQCWDLCAEFWYSIGFSQGFPRTGPNHAAYECWTVSRDVNKGDKFDLVYNLSDVKQGDIVVYGPTSFNEFGHIGFADENYKSSKGGYLALLGQNQGSGGTPPAQDNPLGGTTANVKDILTSGDFLGAFRYKEWESGPTPPPHVPKKTKFKWVLYTRKLNQMRNNL